MKLYRIKFALLVASFALACSGNKEQPADSDSNEPTADSVQDAVVGVLTQPEQTFFVGEYLVGEGDVYIVPVGDTYEMRDGTGKASDVFTLQGKENDTLTVYSNKDKSVTFKMNPDHKTGRYFSPEEELPVELVGPLEQ